jgi:hypothetical protein
MIKAIETYYSGYRFRSRLEARWAVFFDAITIKYQYEPEGYILADGTPYLPDFYLPDYGYYVEIKGKEPTDAEKLKAASLDKQTYIFYGDVPYPNPLEQDDWDNAIAVFGIDEEDGSVILDTGYWWCECPRCGCVDLHWHGRIGRSKYHKTWCDPHEKEFGANTPRLLNAYAKARSARFEFAERERL